MPSGDEDGNTIGPWDPGLHTLRAWDPKWAESCVAMTSNPWTNGILPRKFIEWVGVALNAACTNLNPDGTRRVVIACGFVPFFAFKELEGVMGPARLRDLFWRRAAAEPGEGG